ncbi:ankyrin repeat-containing domain protein [Mycena pura]|uniref:Ankyrin repeat-containing domain protein n=1 Tax=Mycena pura TaxID=153505 RepID=A0AAD6XWD0_9AGAR|nr:ankyrin repeat-containing domain protein [Mycena pura]
MSRENEGKVSTIAEVSERLEGGQNRFLQTMDDAQRTKLIQWLSPINFFQRQAEILDLRKPGTGEWLLRDTRFKQWETGSGGILWCRGMPGAGKTVLASVVVNHLKLDAQIQEKNVGSACIYLNHKETRTQTPSNLLAGLWRQLVFGKPIPSDSMAQKLYQQYSEKDIRPSLAEVHKVLCSVLKTWSRVYIVVDALDEYPEDQRNILVNHLITMDLPVSLMLISRHNINLALPDFETLDIYASRKDIKTFVNLCITESSRLTLHVNTCPKLRKEMVTKITANARGMFLLAKLHIASLATKATVEDVQKALETLPTDLKDTYTEAMKRINHQNEDDRNLALAALTWVANAKRLLTVRELQDALAVKPKVESVNSLNRPHISIIVSICPGLIIVDAKSSTPQVRLVHYTTQGHLDSIQDQWFPDAHTRITQTLLTYMRVHFDVLPIGGCNSEDLSDSEDNLSDTEHPLLDYSQYCLRHAAGKPETLLGDMIMAFLQQASRWKEIAQWKVPPWDFQDWPVSPSPLWVAASSNLLKVAESLLDFETPVSNTRKHEEISTQKRETSALGVALYYGHSEMAQMLIEHGADVNHPGGQYGNALRMVSAQKQEDLVHLLIEKGANVNASGKHGTALYTASARGHKDIVQLLIRKKADIDSVGGKYGTPIQVASIRGKIGIVRLLIEAGANVNGVSGKYGSTLQLASSKGWKDIVCLLLDNKADLDAVGGEYGSALQAALLSGNLYIAHLLIDKGADVNIDGGEYGTALQVAIVDGDDVTVSRLIKAGANINALSRKYGSALHVASQRAHSRGALSLLVHMLIEKGADVNAVGGEYGTALQAASALSCMRHVELLIKKGANVNAVGGKYGTALQAAATLSVLFTGIARRLIDERADVNVVSGVYGTALQAASARGHEIMVDLLLQKGAEVNVVGGKYSTALQAASANGHEYIVRLLLANEANVNALNGEYGTALQAASANGHKDIVCILIASGAKVNAVSGEYGTALQAASAGGHKDIVSILTDNEADLHMVGGRHGGALQAALMHEHDSCVRLLIQKGADINAMWGEYGSLVQAASAEGHENIVRLLIKHGAEVNVVGGKYGTALQAASVTGHDKIVRLLISKGANVNAVCEPHGTALQAAAMMRHERVVRHLLEKGADVDAEGGIFGGALQAASAMRQEGIVRLLIENGAKPMVAVEAAVVTNFSLLSNPC